MGSSYTFFKSLDLSRSNDQKKTLINANILIDLIYYPLFNTFHTYFYTQKNLCYQLFLSPLHVSVSFSFSFSLHISLSLYLLHHSSTSTTWLPATTKKKKKATICHTLLNNTTIDAVLLSISTFLDFIVGMNPFFFFFWGVDEQFYSIACECSWLIDYFILFCSLSPCLYLHVSILWLGCRKKLLVGLGVYYYIITIIFERITKFILFTLFCRYCRYRYVIEVGLC